MTGDGGGVAVQDVAAGTGDAPPRRRRWQAGLVLAVWVLAFALTRLLPVALTLEPTLYGPDISDPTGDLRLYGEWGEQAVLDGAAPYRDIAIEYPPGSLPFVIVPTLIGHGEFSRGAFIALLLALDAVAFGALLLRARRQRSYGGVLAWLLLVPLLGVLVYGRLDMVPAVATLLALERAHARRWFSSGVWFGLGAAAKLFPALLLPLALIAAAGRRVHLVAGAVLGAAVAFLPYVTDLGDVVRDVLGYHSARGIHLESLWGSLLNLQRVGGGPVDLVFEFGAFHIEGPGADTMLRWTTIISVAIVALAVVVAALRWWRHPDRARVELPLAATTVLALLLGTGRVFSPQFMLWLLAAAAVLYTVAPRVARWTWLLLAVTVVLTAAEYPLGFDLLRDGARWPALVLLYRNVAVNVLGVVLAVWWVSGAATGAPGVATAASRAAGASGAAGGARAAGASRGAGASAGRGEDEG